jgi:hypothetical protein
MKKIIKSSVLFFGVCFFTTKLNAQLASEKPAMTAEQVANIMKAQVASKITPATVVSQSAASTSAVPRTTEINKPAQKSAAAVVVSNQGGVNPDNKIPVSEVKTPKVLKQSEMPVEKSIEKPVEKPVKSKQ